jgi:hypothetical protein
MLHRKLIFVALILTSFVGLSGCATVPKDAVYLSCALGEDLEQLHMGYRKTVQFSFEQIRERGLYAIEETWTPAFVEEFVVTGGLVEAAKNRQFDRVEYWADLAVEKIEEQRRSFLDSLQVKEDALLSQIDMAFSRAIRANASLTAMVKSVKKVEDLQDQVLLEFGVKDIRDTIDKGIVDASDFADRHTKNIRELTEGIEAKTETPSNPQ